MSTLENASLGLGLPAAGEAVSAGFVAEEGAPARGWWSRLDGLLERLGELLNPILVKETRQALKSKQFSITFGLVLLFGWIWSMLGLAIQGPAVYHGNFGPYMFAGYYVVLAFPLLVIVPVGAFRSLAAEREDGTYELLSVTTLRPRQVVGGKLGSAMLQMLIYLSAMTPFLAFTYMLRGIDFPTILLVVYYTVLASLGLSLAGLMLATVTQEKHWQVVLLVFVVFGLGLAFLIACTIVFNMLEWNTIPFQDEEFWYANGAITTAYVSYFALFFCAAAAQLTFSSENRSTWLRVAMLAQQALLIGWITFVFVRWPDVGTIFAFLTLIGIHWHVMGAFMTGESPELSPRVQRSLPQSFLGRMLLTWLNPGPATGYVFALANLYTAAALAAGGTLIWITFFAHLNTGFGSIDWEPLGDFLLLGLCYVTIYLGVGRLLAGLANRFVQGGILVGLLLQVVLFLFGSLVPLFFHWMSVEMRDSYWLVEITSPIYTLIAAATESLDPDQRMALLIALPITATLVLLANLPAVAREVRFKRIARPDRVAEEDAQQRAIAFPPRQVQISPWDYETRQS